MSILVFLLFFLALAVFAPLYGVDTTDATSERSRPPAGWWPGGPDAR